jgi:hypothetical protein
MFETCLDVFNVYYRNEIMLFNFNKFWLNVFAFA